MALKYNQQVNDVIKQTAKNVDQLFSLLTSVQKQVEKLSNLVIEEAAGVTQKVSKEFVTVGGKIGDETIRVAQDCLDNSVATVFPERAQA